MLKNPDDRKNLILKLRSTEQENFQELLDSLPEEVIRHILKVQWLKGYVEKVAMMEAHIESKDRARMEAQFATQLSVARLSAFAAGAAAVAAIIMAGLSVAQYLLGSPAP